MFSQPSQMTISNSEARTSAKAEAEISTAEYGAGVLRSTAVWHQCFGTLSARGVSPGYATRYESHLCVESFGVYSVCCKLTFIAAQTSNMKEAAVARASAKRTAFFLLNLWAETGRDAQSLKWFMLTNCTHNHALYPSPNQDFYASFNMLKNTFMSLSYI